MIIFLQILVTSDCLVRLHTEVLRTTEMEMFKLKKKLEAALRSVSKSFKNINFYIQ